MHCRLVSICIILFLIDGSVAVSRISLNEDEAYPVVNTPVGSIRGLRAEDGNYSMFMGIPYAEVDPDNLFGNSKPYPKFESTFDAFDDSAICPQEEEFNYTIVGSLDCLHINVYVPDSASDDNLLPVFVWIFGGGFALGFPGRFLYGPSFLVRHDIIFVTINYRLGPYGFMCLDIPEVPGNQGLKDQEMALKWIKDNIASFGGDNTKVTIGGNSAGAMAVDLHLYYGEENLYQKIILQSSVALVGGTVDHSDPDAPMELAKFLNYTPSDLKDALSFLATVDPHELIAKTHELGTLSFMPCVEKEFDNVQRFIPEHPVNKKILPKIKDIDVLMGFSNDEMFLGIYELSDFIFPFVDFIRAWLNMNFDFKDNNELYTEMHKIVTHFYFGDKDMTAELKPEVTDSGSDFFFLHPISRTISKYLENGVQTIYLYMFSYLGERNFSKHRLNITNNGGAAHADELGYLFDISYMNKPLDPEDQLIVDRMTEMWANFIKYGNPTPQPSELVPMVWPPVTSDKWHYMELDMELRVATRPFHARMAFLDLFYKMNEIYQRGYDAEELEPSPGNNLVLNLPLLVQLVLIHLVVGFGLRNF